MNLDDLENEMLDHACKGNAEAISFLNAALAVFHGADDLLDEDTTEEFKIAVMVSCMSLYAEPFFLRHAHALNTAIRTCVNTYADSVRLEKSAEPMERQWADMARHCGMEIVLVVADICGGWNHRRKVSRELRAYNLRCAALEKVEKQKG